MTTDGTSTYQGFLRDMVNPMRDFFSVSDVLVARLKQDAADRKAKDDAYLASLSEAERKRVLLLRRIADVERRYRAWWEDNMAWRFRADPPPQYDGDDW